MAREERTSTAVSQHMPLNNPKQIPSEVHQQLIKDFVPAVKDAAHAGNELLRAYQALEKSSEAYAHALENLAKSSHTADLKAQGYGKDLHEILKQYRTYIDYHKDCNKELTSIVSKTTVYSNEEKEKLKGLYSAFQKDEKDIQKAVKKGTKSSTDLDTFYDTSAREFLRQQELRYKFFLDKHKRWFSKYWALLEKIQTERGVIPNGHVNVLNVEKPAEPVVETAAPVSVEEGIVHQNGVTEEQPKDEENKPDTVLPPQDNSITNRHNDDPPFLHTGNSSSRSTISSMDNKIPSRRPSNENIPGVTLLHSERRAQEQRNSFSLQENKFEHITPAPAVHSIPHQAESDKILPAQNISSPIQENRRTSVYQSDRNSVVAEQPVQARKYEYHGPIIVPAPVPRTREPDIIKQRETPLMVPRTVDAPVYARLQAENVQHYQPPPERPHYHVEVAYNPSVSPAHRPTSQNFSKPAAEQLVVPSMFNASDYGRTLTVTQDFNATSGEQMTVNRGDRVILIKSGTRGWIFIQDQATQRTGWIPAPFVSY